MIRILQLDGDSLFREEVRDHCGRLDDLEYRGAATGEGILQAFNGDKPHVILLDMNLEPQGGLVMLEEIRTRYSADEVKVILMSDEAPGEEGLSRTVALGANYFLLRPCDLVILEKRIRQLVRRSTVPPGPKLTLRQVQFLCTTYFEQMGIPPHYKGYRYLMEGIWLCSLHPKWLNSVTQNLYPAIAQRHEVNGAQVERAMRYALDVTWEKGNVEQLYKFFPYVRENKGKPTCSSFIATMVDVVGLEASKSG